MQKTQLTKDGYEKLKNELDELVKNKKPYAIDRLQTARSMGDLSENSEYSAAKEDLAFVEGRVREIEEILKNVEIIENHNHAATVSLGSTITVELNGIKSDLNIVGEFEADPMEKKLSSTSPIGKALLGRKIGELVTVEVPDGKITYKILAIK